MIETEKFLENKTVFYFLAAVFLTTFLFFWNLRPVLPGSAAKTFQISSGESFLAIANRLDSEKLIRSRAAFEIYSIATGSAGQIKPGIYEFSGGLSIPEIIDVLTGPAEEVEVMIPDGASVRDIDAILSGKKILPANSLIFFAEENDIEGKFYPDTYKFYKYSSAEVVAAKFSENFRNKAEPILIKDPINYKNNLIR